MSLGGESPLISERVKHEGSKAKRIAKAIVLSVVISCMAFLWVQIAFFSYLHVFGVTTGYSIIQIIVIILDNLVFWTILLAPFLVYDNWKDRLLCFIITLIMYHIFFALYINWPPWI